MSVSADAIAVTSARDDRTADRVGTLFDTHHRRLYGLARRLSATTEDAQDLVQETFLRVARAPRHVPSGHSREEAWLVRILVNICRDRWRRTATRRRRAHLNRADSTAGPTTEATLIAQSEVWRGLRRLPPRRRAVVVMHELEGLAVAQIARQLGVAAVTVRWHLALGRRELARIIRGARERR